MTFVVHATHPNTVWWSVSPARDATDLQRLTRWYQAQLEGLPGATLDVIERDGAAETLLKRSTWRDGAWTSETGGRP